MKYIAFLCTKIRKDPLGEDVDTDDTVGFSRMILEMLRCYNSGKTWISANTVELTSDDLSKDGKSLRRTVSYLRLIFYYLQLVLRFSLFCLYNTCIGCYIHQRDQ